MRKGPDYDYDKLNIIVIICDKVIYSVDLCCVLTVYGCKLFINFCNLTLNTPLFSQKYIRIIKAQKHMVYDTLKCGGLVDFSRFTSFLQTRKKEEKPRTATM